MLFFYIALNMFSHASFKDEGHMQLKISTPDINKVYSPVYVTDVKTIDDFNFHSQEDFYLKYRLRFSKKL